MYSWSAVQQAADGGECNTGEVNVPDLYLYVCKHQRDLPSNKIIAPFMSGFTVTLQTLAAALGLETTGFTVEAGPAQAGLAAFAFELVSAVWGS